MNVAAALPIVEIANTKFDEVVLQSCPHLMGCGKYCTAELGYDFVMPWS